MDALNEREWQDDARGKAQRGLPPTPRQIEVFLSVLRWSSLARAATALGVTRNTVQGHAGRLMARLGARSTAEVAVMLWEGSPELRDRMVLPRGELGQRPERRKRQRRRR